MTSLWYPSPSEPQHRIAISMPTYALLDGLAKTLGATKEEAILRGLTLLNTALEAESELRELGKLLEGPSLSGQFLHSETRRAYGVLEAKGLVREDGIGRRRLTEAGREFLRAATAEHGKEPDPSVCLSCDCQIDPETASGMCDPCHEYAKGCQDAMDC